MEHNKQTLYGTTVVGLLHDGKAVMGADGQVTLGSVVMKKTTKKIRRLHQNSVLAGFAGATADAFALLQRFEEKLEANRGNLERSAVDFSKDWRTDRYLRRLEAMMVVMNKQKILLLSGTGDVIEPDESIIAIGSGGSFAMAAARGLIKHSSLSPGEIVAESLRIASDICIYTNDNITLEELQ